MGDRPSASPGRGEKDSKSHRIFFCRSTCYSAASVSCSHCATYMQRCNCTPSSIVEHEHHARHESAHVLAHSPVHEMVSPFSRCREYSQSYDSAVMISGVGSCRSHLCEEVRLTKDTWRAQTPDETSTASSGILHVAYFQRQQVLDCILNASLTSFNNFLEVRMSRV